MYATVLITKGTAMTKKHTVTITIAKYDLKQIIHNAIRDNLLKYNSKQTMQQLTVNKAQLQSNLRKLENSIIKLVKNMSMGNSTKATNIQDLITVFMHKNNIL